MQRRNKVGMTRIHTSFMLVYCNDLLLLDHLPPFVHSTVLRALPCVWPAEAVRRDRATSMPICRSGVREVLL
jgi:hypothetical protein